LELVDGLGELDGVFSGVGELDGVLLGELLAEGDGDGLEAPVP
jgi:hypothetical protein